MRSRFFFRRTAGYDRLLCAAACQIIFCIAVITGKFILAESRAHIAVFQALHRLIEQDRRLSGIGVIGGVGGFVAGGAHSIAGAAGRTRIAGIAQQIQRFGGILFRVQQNPHTNGGIQLLPAVFAGKIRHTVVVVRAFLLGRIVLPKELRTSMHLDTDTKLEIFVDGDSIVLKKHRPAGSCDFCGEVDESSVQFAGYCICPACRRKIGAL